MPGKTNAISILQVNDHLISWVRARRTSNGVAILDLQQERGAWNLEDGSLEAALKAFVAKHTIANDAVYTVLPRHVITSRIICLPSQEPSEISAMIRLSAEEYVPFRVQELVIDECVLRTTPDGQAWVLAVFAQRDVVDEHVNLLKSVGLQPEKILLSTACLASAAVAARANATERYAVVNLAAGGLEAIVISGNRLEYGRGVATGQDWPDDGATHEPIIDELAGEVRASMAAYQRESEDGASVERVFVSSDALGLGAFADSLTVPVDCPCVPAEFGREITARQESAVTDVPPVLLGAALAAQGRAAVSIDLTPEWLTQARSRARARQRVARMAIVAGAFLLGVLGLYAQAVHQRKAYIKELEQRIAAVAPEATGIIAKRRQLGILRQQVDRSASVLELLSALCSLAPDEGMNITRFAYKRGAEIQVSGRALSRAIVDSLSERLREFGQAGLPQFAHANVLYMTNQTERGKPVVDFAIEMPLKAGEDDASGGQAGE